MFNKLLGGFSYKKENDFSYMDKNLFYFDSACQSLRPQSVIDAQNRYFYEFNSCGGRVKYPWGEKLDNIIDDTRKEILKLVKKDENQYSVAFGLNSTHLINSVLMQLKSDLFDEIITTDIEHNSVFLPSIIWSKKNKKNRIVLNRDEIGTIDLSDLNDKKKSIFIANTTSNIDGRELENLSEITKKIKLNGGIVLLDSCQTFAHDYSILQKCEFDACFGSGHKMYGPSLGFVIFRKDLIPKMNFSLIGGSTVVDTRFDDYDLISDSSELYMLLEAGLQNYSAIVGLNESIRWLNSKKNRLNDEVLLANYLFQELNKIEGVNLLNKKPSCTVSLYSPKIDSHKLGTLLSSKGIMCRTGYHCCHYYLKHKMNYPPLLRISIGLQNTKEQVDYLIKNLSEILAIW